MEEQKQGGHPPAVRGAEPDPLNEPAHARGTCPLDLTAAVARRMQHSTAVLICVAATLGLAAAASAHNRTLEGGQRQKSKFYGVFFYRIIKLGGRIFVTYKNQSVQYIYCLG